MKTLRDGLEENRESKERARLKKDEEKHIDSAERKVELKDEEKKLKRELREHKG